MARADLLLDIVRAGTKGDHLMFRKALEALVVEERAKQHHVLADRLASHLQTDGGAPLVQSSSRRNGPVADLFFEVDPRRSLQDLILPEMVVGCLP